MKARVFGSRGLEMNYGFYCPGCTHLHMLPVTGPKAWGFNGDVVKPTFNPSILRREYYLEEVSDICHSFVTAGKIQFLNDCTHALKGQTVDLAEIDEP